MRKTLLLGDLNTDINLKQGSIKKGINIGTQKWQTITTTKNPQFGNCSRLIGRAIVLGVLCFGRLKCLYTGPLQLKSSRELIGALNLRCSHVRVQYIPYIGYVLGQG